MRLSSQVPVEILDYIFGFLEPKSLSACSEAHATFARIAEKHLYYHIIILARDFDVGQSTQDAYALMPSSLLQKLSETPRLANYVCVLQIHLVERNLEEIALILPILPSLACFSLNCLFSWQQLEKHQGFRTAVEGCLSLPTLREVHIGVRDFPLSMLECHATNITNLWLSNFPRIPDSGGKSDTCLQLKSFSVEDHTPQLFTWVKRRITTLQSLRCNYDLDHEDIISELLETCSSTLNNLDLSFKEFGPFPSCELSSCRSGCGVGLNITVATPYDLDTGEKVRKRLYMPLLDLSSFPCLQSLTIRVDFFCAEWEDEYRVLYYCYSCLAAALRILNTTSSLQRLTIDIWVDSEIGCYPDVDFSPFTAFVERSATLRCIDLYIWSWTREVSYGDAVSLFADYDGLKKLIDEGILVIHTDVTAAKNSQFLE